MLLNNSKQIIYQDAWMLVRNKVAPRVPANQYEEVAQGFLNQLHFSDKFGGTNLIFAGDSNCEFGDTRDQMVAWKDCGIVINIGIAGTRFDTWVSYLSSPAGEKVLSVIHEKQIPIFLNLGGNHVLQGAMDILDSSIEAFLKLFSPDQKFIAADLPDIIIPLLAPLMHVDPDTLKKEVDICNDTLQKYFSNFVKLGEYFQAMDAVNHLGMIFELKNNVLGDHLVHYSPEFNIKTRFPYYSAISKRVFGL